MNEDRLYLDLKGARERLCRAQTSERMNAFHREWLQGALDLIDTLGVWYCPQQWSKFDEPPVPEGE